MLRETWNAPNCLAAETNLLLMVLQRAIVKENFCSNVKNSTNVYVTIDLIRAPLQLHNNLTIFPLQVIFQVFSVNHSDL